VRGEPYIVRFVFACMCVFAENNLLTFLLHMHTHTHTHSQRLRTASSYRLARRMALGKAAVRMLPANIVSDALVKNSVYGRCYVIGSLRACVCLCSCVCVCMYAAAVLVLIRLLLNKE
jgi:hypothetical protein